MRKSKLATAFIFALTALVFTTAALPFAPKTAIAESEQTEQQTQLQNGLIVPQTYKEYLSLENPLGFAACDNYTAIADGNIIYIYDHDDKTYREYIHNYHVSDPPKNNITKLQFDEENNLYFLDQRFLFLLEYEKLDSPEENIATETGFPCTTFLIDGDTLFYTDVKTTATQLSKTPLVDGKPNEKSSSTLVSGLGGTPVLSFWNNELYFTNKSLTTDLYKINPSANETIDFTKMEIGSFASDIVSMTISEGIFAFSCNAGNFYVYSLPGFNENLCLMNKTGNFSTVSSFGNYIYAIDGDIIKQYDTAIKDFTEMEICDNSPARNRLNNAQITCMRGQKLYISDNGNRRISIYNTKNKTFEQPFITDFDSTFIASDQKTLLSANETQATLYSLSSDCYGEVLWTGKNFNGTIVGITEVYGSYYFATNEKYYYVLTQNTKTAQWTLSSSTQNSVLPKLFTSDVYSNLYVASGRTVYRLTEKQLFDPLQNPEKICDSLPTDTIQLLVDYEKNLYALTNNTVQKYNGEIWTQIKLSEKYVYGGKDYTPKITSFAFSFENDAAYILYDNNYLVQTDVFDLPNMRNIGVNGADGSIFANESAVFEVVKTNKNALLVEFDLETLNGATYFPYLSYKRAETETTALKIGESDKYSVIAVFDKQTNGYFTYLVLESSTTALTPEEYQTTYEQTKTGYLSNAVTLYKFPYLCTLLTAQAEKLPRGGTVEILGEINELDHAYYHVSYTDETGAIKTGYIPQAYASLFDGAPPQSEDYLAGAKESDSDAAWRLAYLILGFAAICILTDYLLLRKKKDD